MVWQPLQQAQVPAAPEFPERHPFSTTTGTSITTSYEASTGVLSLTGTDSIENYQTVLQTISYSSTNEDPADISASRTVTFSVTDANAEASGAKTGSATRTVSLASLSDQPVVTTTSGSADYAENGSAVAIASALTLSDPDDTHIASGSVSVSTGFTAGDTLAATTSGTSVSASYDSGTGVLSLSGTDTLANYQSVLQSVTYSSSSEDPTASETARTITFAVTDANSDGAGAHSGSATRGINLTPLNDAPLLVAANPQLTALTEDETGNSGQTIASVVGSSISDVDTGAKEGIAIVSLIAGNGVWQYSVDSGVNWSGIGEVAETSALLLSASDVIRFVPNGQNETAASVTYQAWDQTSGTAGSKSDASSNGTTTAFSTVNDTASIVATAVNDAPTLAGGPFSLPQTTEDTTSAGTLISDILTGLTFGDVDSGAASGIALTAQSGNGAWQYSMDGTDWTVFGALSGNSALLLNSATQVRYVPDEKNAEIGSVTFHAWDQTSGTASTNGSPQTGDTTSNGETSAYSTGSALAEIAITAVNDAPILSPQAPNLGTTDEDTTTAGITISSFVISDTGTADTATGLSDADTGAVRGIALSGQTGNGTWEFSASGTSWTAVGTVSSSAALLLPDSYQLRYVPDNQNEEIPTLAYYGWDQFSGSSESTVDLSGTDATGGTTAFSTATDTASLTVTAVDDAPVLAALPNRSITELSTLTLTATASDVDLPADTLTFSLDSGAPAGAAIDPSTGAFSWTPSESQGPASFEITVRVTDDGTSNLSATQTFTVNVSESNSEPVFGTVTNQVVTEGETMNVVLSASDNDLPANTLTFSLVSPLPGMVVDGSTGIVSWTPGEADGPGTYSIFVQVSDNGTPTLSVRQSFSVTVSESNNAPVIPAIGDQTVKEHETLTLQISASDSDVPANQLSYALSNDAPAGTALDSASGQFSWTPTETQGPGTYTITVQVQDTGSPALTGTQSFQVIVEEVNQAPTLSSFGGNLAFEGAEMQVPLVAFDSDVPAQTITWTLGADAPQGVLLDAGVPALRWTPNEAQGPGTYSFGIEATDDGSPPQNVSSTVTIAVQEINQAPVFATVGPQAVVKGEMLTVDLIATDADLPVQSLTYSLDAGAPSGAAVNETSGQFTWLPAAAATPGSYAITILAADNGTPSQSGTVTINVELTDGNRAPVLAATVTQIVDEGQELNVVLAATDANVPSQNLSYGLGINAPAGVSVDSASGLLSWTPSEEEGPGNYSIEVEVSDDGVPPLTTTGIVNVEVGEVNTAPVLTAIEDQTISEGETLNLTAMATDTDLPGNNLTYSLGTGESAGMAIDTNSGALSWTPEKTQSGAAYDATLIVTDNGTPALQDQKSFVVTVLAVNDPPTIGAISDQATIDGVAVGSIAFEVNDADNSPDSLTVTGASSNTALIPADGILIAGTGINRTVSVQPASGQVGTAAITLEVSDADGATASVSFDVAVEAAAPAITSEFINPAILAGESLILEAQATGTPPLSYQWFFGNAAVDGATQSTFALTNLQVNQAGTYSVEVTNSAGSDLKDVAQVSVNAELGITTEPADLTVIQGETAVFEVIAGGTPPLAHQWNFGGNAIDGATTQTLTLENVQANQAGSYTVDITNAAGSVSSRTALLQVLVPPVIILQPTDTSVIEGGSAAFTAGVSGSQPLTYQWQRNGIDIAGATDSTLALSAVAAADEGTYGVSVSNAGGSIESQAASLTVNVPAQVSDSQQDVVIGVGNPLNLTVDASGTPPFTYQWYLNGTQIDGATEVSFSIAVAQLSDSGEYTVVVTNPVGPIAGPIFNVTVIEAVLIASQPQNVDAKKGDEVRISVGVEGTGPFTYQWELNGAIFSTTSQPELILSGVPLDAAGTYRVRVSNLVSEVLSQDAIVTVTDQAQLTGLPAELVVEVGGELALQVTADGSPPFQYQWQLNGVNISGATTDTFQISNAQSTDGGTYSVTVTDGGGATTSNSTSVIINTPDLGLASDAASASPASASSGDGRGNNLGASPAWMAWNSPGTGIASFSTQGSGFDTLLTVYQGSPDNLTHVASDEDSGGFLTSTTSFNTDTGVTYYVAVDGFKGAQGAIALRWDWVQTSEPLPVITTQPQSQTVLFEQPVAFSVVAESSSGSTLSYQWFLDGVIIASANAATLSIASAGALNVGEYTVEVSNTGGMVTSSAANLQINLIATGSEGSGVDTVDKIGSSSSTGAGLASVAEGEKNSIARRSIRRVGLRSLLQGTRGEKLFSSKSAVKDAGEPNHCRVLGGASTWFIYEPPQNGALRVSTEGSTFDTVLAAYTSPTSDVDFITLTEVACNNNGGSDGQTSVMEFPVEVGTRYYLVVDGVNGQKGIVHFTYEVSQPPTMSQPTWFRVDGASGQLDETQENPIVGVGSSVEFRIGIGGLPTTAQVDYQWRRNGIDVTGGTSERLLLSNLSQADSGNYTVEVTTFAGTAESQGTSFTVAEPIQLLLNPDDQTVVAGRSAYFAVVPFGAGPFEYQWSLNGQPLPGLTTSAIILSDVQQGNAGLYEVAIADGVSQTIASATLTVQEALVITAQPVGQSVVTGQSIQLSVNAQGVEPLNYQWQHNGVDIAGAIAPALELTDVQVNQTGEYTVVVSNAFQTITSDPAVVTVRVLLSIAQQPVSQSVPTGGQAAFSVSATGNGNLSYQWQFNGGDLPGATAALFGINDVQQSHAGSYRVVVSDSDGSVTSQEAILTVENLSEVLLLGLTSGVGDEVTLHVDGGEGVNVEVQSTEDFTQWTALQTVRIQNGQVTFIDPNAAVKTFQFYRLQVAP